MMNGLAKGKRIGFISTRFAGTDGVSLEARKWAEVLERNGHANFWFAGKLDTDPAKSMLVPEAFFEDPANMWINEQVFGHHSRTRACTSKIHQFKEELKDKIYEFLEKFKIDVIVSQNCVTIPMHIPLGLAVAEVKVESRLPMIAHHHDFYWERDRFAINAVADCLEMAFPPRYENIQHVVINTPAKEQLAFRTGISSHVIPNVIDFNAPPPTWDNYNASLRSDLGLTADDKMILQPTRIVSRKGIEHAIELVRRLNDKRYKLVISHEAGDEGFEYQQFLMDYAASVGVDMRIAARKISSERADDKELGKKYTLADVYLHADLVTYPSLYEGFGNAFLEAIYFRKPLLVNRYSIYIRDIEPKGFNEIEMNGYVTEAAVEEARRVLEDEVYREEMVNHNFELGRKYYSYEVLERSLNGLLAEM